MSPLDRGALAFAAAVWLSAGARAEPVRVPLDEVVDLSVGDSHACAVTADGLVHCWGDGRDHRLGNGRELSSRVPLQVPGLRGVVRVAAGGHVTCVLRADGEVLCWGGLARRTIRGEDHFEPVVEPRVVATAMTGTVDLSVGRQQVALVDRAGDVSILSMYEGPIPLPGFRGIREVASFSEGFCGIARDGQVHCVTSNESVVWDGGAGGYGEEPSAVLRPMSEVPAEARDIYTEVCAGGESRPAWCRETARLAGPRDAAARPGAVRRGIDIHGGLACLLVDAAAGPPALGCFGCADCFGEEAPPIGLGQEPVAVPVLIAAASGLSGMADVAVGGRHVCVLADKVYCWGDSAEGQLGARPLSFVAGRTSWEGSTFPVLEPRLGSSTPLAISGLGEVVRLEAGDATTCALGRDGAVFCWGRELGTPPAESLRGLARPDAMPGVERTEVEPLGARAAPPGEVCRELDVFARDRLEERRYGYDAKGRLVRVELRAGPTSELVSEERYRLSRDGRVVWTDRGERLGERWHRSSVRFRHDRAGRVVWSKARGSTNDDVQAFRYDREGRLVEERDGAFRQRVRHVVWPASVGDPIGLSYPDTWPEGAIVSEALTVNGWDEARHLEVVLDGSLLYEREVGRGEVIATTYGTEPGGVELVRAHHFAWGFYERPLRRVETRTIPASSQGAPAAVEQWEAVGDGPLTLTRRTQRVETGCLE